MKKIGQKSVMAIVVLLLLAGCKKDLKQVVLSAPASSTLTASANAVVLDSTGGGTKTALTLNWPAPNYGVQVIVTNTLQIDSVNGNFSKPVSVNLSAGVSMTYTMAGLNNIALSLGLVPAVAGKLQARVVTNVNQSTGAASTVPSLISNVVSLTVTPYSTKPQPKYPVPANLYLVGGATASGWANPVSLPTQQFTPIDDYSFGMVVQLTGGQQFLFLPVNGDWSHKYAVTVSSPSPTGDVFVPDAPNNMNGPTATGLYKIVVDFVKGTYTTTPAAVGDIPTNLYIIGDATAGGWTNPVPVPGQQFTQLSSGAFRITVPLLSSGSYLFLPKNGDWAVKYGGASATGGALLANSAVPNSNTPIPGPAGSYTIDVNFFAKTYSVK